MLIFVIIGFLVTWAALLYFALRNAGTVAKRLDEESEGTLVRSLNLAIGPHNHPDSCRELAALRRLGWDISTRGNALSGEITIVMKHPERLARAARFSR
jgi:hypothetical protein